MRIRHTGLDEDDEEKQQQQGRGRNNCFSLFITDQKLSGAKVTNADLLLFSFAKQVPMLEANLNKNGCSWYVNNVGAGGVDASGPNNTCQLNSGPGTDFKGTA